MRELTVNELSEVNGGEILVSPGQLGIALTNNTLIVITGTVEATTVMSALGVLSAAAVFGYNLGSWLNDTFNLSSYYAELCWNITH
jgi:hypothetical protein